MAEVEVLSAKPTETFSNELLAPCNGTGEGEDEGKVKDEDEINDEGEGESKDKGKSKGEGRGQEGIPEKRPPKSSGAFNSPPGR